MKQVAAISATLVMALWLLPALAAAAAAPAIEYSTPSTIRNKEATLRFAIDPEGIETSHEVEIAKVGKSLESREMPDGLPLSGEKPVALEVNVPRYWEGGMSPGTEYHWRVTAWNDEGKTVGAEQFFTTTDGPTPAFSAAIASQAGSNRVRFTGTVDPEGAPLTGCRFRWVDKNTFMYAGFEKWAAVEMVRFGKTVPCNESVEEIGSGTEPVHINGEATDLEPGEYFFRLEGENAFEDSTSYGGVPFTVWPGFEVAPGPPPTAVAAPGPPPTAGIRSTRAFVGKGGWFRLQVYCVAPEGFVCGGPIWVTAAGIRPGFGDTVPLAVRHHYSLAAGSERAIGICLHSWVLSGEEWRPFHVIVHISAGGRGEPAHKEIRLKRAPLPRRET